MKIKKFHIQINKEEVLRSMDCYKDSPLYEEFSDEYDVLVDKVYALNEACALVAVGTLPEEMELDADIIGKKAIFILLTLGNKIEKESDSLFRQGDYLEGLLLNAIANHYLLEMEHEVESYLEKICEEENMGIAKRMEAPGDLPMEFQKVIYDRTNAREEGIHINECFMLSPIKSMSYIYLASDDQNEFHVGHNCMKCKVKDCMMKRAKAKRIKINLEEKITQVFCYPGESVMDAMQRENISVSFPCAGRGVCGKCKIRLNKGTLDVTNPDYEFLSKEQIDQGYRLACQAFPKEDCEISLAFQTEEKHEVLSEFRLDKTKQQDSEDKEFLESYNTEHKTHTYGIGIDIGTTTLAMQLVDLEAKTVLDTFMAMNRQRKFGADVISRIEAQKNGKGKELQNSIQQDIKSGIEKLSKERNIEKIVIAGNTTMIHLLLGLPCKTLGEYPFTPVNISRITGQGELLGMGEVNAEVVIYPGISTFVGGDIVAGLMACEFQKNKKISMLIDLGTNGEMAIGNADKIISTSTAAGPAFEGGNISCGTGSIPGAISGMELGKEIVLQTIGNQSPTGICGTGIVEAVAELIKIEALDETGLLVEEYFDDGYILYENKAEGIKIAVIQKDIREFQLAKSAVRTGIELLIERYETSYEEIDKVYLAGGFGYAMNISKAVQIGLFPPELEGKILPVGNAALNGTLKELFNECSAEDETGCIATATELSLSTDKKFSELYMDYMFFE